MFSRQLSQRKSHGTSHHQGTSDRPRQTNEVASLERTVSKNVPFWFTIKDKYSKYKADNLGISEDFSNFWNESLKLTHCAKGTSKRLNSYGFFPKLSRFLVSNWQFPTLGIVFSWCQEYKRLKESTSLHFPNPEKWIYINLPNWFLPSQSWAAVQRAAMQPSVQVFFLAAKNFWHLFCTRRSSPWWSKLYFGTRFNAKTLSYRHLFWSVSLYIAQSLHTVFVFKWIQHNPFTRIYLNIDIWANFMNL